MRIGNLAQAGLILSCQLTVACLAVALGATAFIAYIVGGAVAFLVALIVLAFDREGDQEDE